MRKLIRPVITLRRRRIIVDVDTQKDFMLAEGKVCVRNHRRVLQNIRRVMAWARVKNIRVISTEQIYDKSDRKHTWCIAGTEGAKKIAYTVRSNHIVFPADGCTDLPRDILKRHDQIILHKRCINPFDEPRIDRLLSEVWANEFVLIGTSAEGAVEATALGLLQRRKKVSVVVDAVGSRNKREAKLALRKMKAKGARLIETKKLAGTSHLKHVRDMRLRKMSEMSGENTD